ncbi:MAG: trypsin-like peptidase domain-containing protein [Tepidisphaeraceae bacterium]
MTTHSSSFERRIDLTKVVRAASVAIIAACGLASLGATQSEQLKPITTLAAFEPTTQGNPVALQDQFRSISEKAAKSIVAITALTSAPTDSALWSNGLTGERFAKLTEGTTRSVGTGFCIASGGWIVTSEHVVSGSASVWITTDDGHVYPALVVGTDPRGDFAVLRVPIDLPALAVAHPGSTKRGDWCITVGNPAGLSGEGGLTAAVGTVGAVGRSLPGLSQRENRSYADLLQLSTPIAPGSSGGPVLNLSGEVIGLVCAVVPPGASGQAIGFACPINGDNRTRLDLLTRGEEVVYPYLGVSVTGLPDDQASQLAGVRVDDIDVSAPADGVLHKGDWLVAVNGQAVTSDDGFARLVAASTLDRPVVLTVRRGKADVELHIRPRKRQLVAPAVTAFTQRVNWAGAAFRNRFDSSGNIVGVVVESGELLVSPTVRLRTGDQVRELFGENVNNLSEAQALLWQHAGK